MNKNDRSIVHKGFINDNQSVIVATTAFGMGIDCEISVIVNYGIPSTIEEYYQQIGRSGRSGNQSYAYTFYDISDNS